MTNIRKKRLERAGMMKHARIWMGRALLVVIALIVLFWLGKQAYVFCVAKVIRTENAQRSTLSSNYNGEAIIMRNETVVAAPADGSVERLVPGGARVHIGSTVARINGTVGPETGHGPIELQSPAAGTVCYHLDGWEGILTPANCQRMDLFALFSSIKKKGSSDPPQVVQNGSPVYKVIDNLINPYFAIKLDKKPLDLAAGDRVEIDWSAGGLGKGRVVDLYSRQDADIVVVEVSETNQDLSEERLKSVILAEKRGEGIVLPVQALVARGKERGVYIRTPVGFKFTKVQVLATLGDRVALDGIQPGEDVVLTPGLLKRIDQEN